MSTQPKFKELMLASFNVESYNPGHTRMLMLNAFLFITLVTDGALFIFNLLWSQNCSLCMIQLGIGAPIFYALILLRRKKDYKNASYLSTFILFLGYLALIILLKGGHFSMIWSYFFAPFSMIILGARKGLFISIIFLVFALSLSYTGVGIWMHGLWDLASYIRFAISQIVMLYVIYAITNSNEKAYEKIASLRQRELAQLKLFEKLSITDPLTSLYNRRSLKEIFPKEFYAAQREKKYFAYLLLDLDHFKHYNDTYGHKKGDDVLIEIAALLKQTCKYAFRIGGDEFAGILIADSSQKIKKRVNNLRQQVYDLHIKHSQNPIAPYVTCSIGVHIVQAYEYDFIDIYNHADKALYKAKAQGRNMVVFL